MAVRTVLSCFKHAPNENHKFKWESFVLKICHTVAPPPPRTGPQKQQKTNIFRPKYPLECVI